MVEIENLSRAYGDFFAVRDVSFRIEAGEIVGLLGHNGAGKTTVMKMISGYLEPGKGRIEVDGINLAQDRAAVQARLGYLPENLPIYPEMTVADYLDYAARLKGLQGSACTVEVRRVIRATEIGAKLLAPISTLSRGYKQRVGVAQALLGKPKLLILDEPTNGLDPTQTQHMRTLIKNIASEATVILSTHIMQEVDALCDRVLILRNGVLALDAKLEDLRKSQTLRIDTDLPDLPRARQLLTGIDGLVSIEALAPENAVRRYELHLNADADAKRTGAAIARALVASEHALFELALEHRDLETVFREVNESEEVAHVA